MDPSTTLPAGWIPGKNPKLFQEMKTSGFKDEDEWCFPFNSKGVDDGFKRKCYMTEEEMVMVMGPVISCSHSVSSNKLLQNCDLPPPVKIFTGRTDKPLHHPLKHNLNHNHFSSVGQENGEMSKMKVAYESDKVDLMKALQLSQSRARTAEKEASKMAKENDRLSNLLFGESLRLFAHRQWVKLLQVEISHLQSQKFENSKDKVEIDDDGVSEVEVGENVGSLTWFMTLALCLGIASVGVAVGCKYLF